MRIVVVFLLIGAAAAEDADEQQQQQRQPKQLNLGDLFGTIGQLAQGNANGNTNRNPGDPFGDLISDFVENVSFGFGSNGDFQIGLGTTPSTFVDNFTQPFFTTTARAPFFPPPPTPPPPTGSTECRENNVEYIGEDLNVVNNGIRNKQRNWRRCLSSCQQNFGCEGWVYVKRRETGPKRRACFLKSSRLHSVSNRNRVSGPRNCSGGGGPATSRPTRRPTILPPTNPNCRTVGGANVGAACQLPFRFRGRILNGCTKFGADDGKYWCSTLVGPDGYHAAGQGQWGHCQGGLCPYDLNGTPIGGPQPPFQTPPPNTPPPTPPPPPNTPPPTPPPPPRTPPPTPPPPPVNPPRPDGLTECGQNARRFQTKIVGGRPADKDEWPWLAALIRPQTSSSGQYCGATLISDRFVLTAAHCIAKFQKEQIRVTLGEYDFGSKGETGDETYGLSAMKMHEGYDRRTFENDIALLKVDRAVRNTRSVYPICLPARGRNYTDSRAFVIGWGTIYFGGPTSPLLQEVNVRVWNNEDCSRNYARLNRRVADSMLCAGEVGRDACQGDSGGPLNCLNFDSARWELCGIVSWGARCAEPDYPGVYTKTTNYLDWIRSNMNSL